MLFAVATHQRHLGAVHALGLFGPMEADVCGKLGPAIAGHGKDVGADADSITTRVDSQLNDLRQDTDVSAPEMGDHLQNLADFYLSGGAQGELAPVALHDICGGGFDDLAVTWAKLTKIGRTLGLSARHPKSEAFLNVSDLLEGGGGGVLMAAAFHD